VVRRSIITGIVFFSLLAAGFAAGKDFTTVILVRHAEKVSETEKDPILSEAGRKRAAKLAGMLSNSGVGAVYSTPYIRTKDTAAPVAKYFGITTAIVDAKNSAELVKKIQSTDQGKTILVVGHSNTVPEIIHLLGGPKMEEIDERLYDDFFVVTFSEPGHATVLHLKY
jgi:broad specificity phosphatase PhoE